MKDYQLNNIDPEDIEDLLVKVESSFGIKFVGSELIHLLTFGQLCDHIADKIQLMHSDDCTSQQAFYKLRDAISSILLIDGKIISPNSPLTDLLPRKVRRLRTTMLENHLGFKLNILRPSHWVTRPLTIVLAASSIGLFFHWQTALIGFIISAGGLWFAYETANELSLRTIGQLAERLTREKYLKSRRNAKKFNKKEVEKILTDWFSDEFGMDKVSREALL